ncbi:MAG: sulfatase-like hydrolase/transferase, partial [Mariniphaga sp.]
YRPSNHPMHLRDKEVTLAELLKEEEYQTAIFGKWHLGCLPQDEKLNHPQPEDHGFDYYFATENNAEPSHHNPVNFVRNGKKLGQLTGYSCQIVADEVISWMENHHKSRAPFFMYVAFHEPHASTQKTAPPKLVKKYSHFPEREANCYANIENLDSAAGRIINHLIDKDLFDNTIVFFASDNGSYRLKANGGLKAVKSYLYEGGIRVPGIAHWKGFKNKPGLIIEEPAGLIDIFPTICTILNVQTNNDKHLDGTSISDLPEEKVLKREKPLFWFFYRTSPEIALRTGDHIIMGKDNDKVPRSHQFSARDMTYIKSLSLKDYELYNLSDDPSQLKNILNESPQKDHYIKLINDKLEEIKNKGYRWNQLPLKEDNPRRIKTEWVKY